VSRVGLIVALVIAVITGLMFGIFPQLDLATSRYFYGFVDSASNVFSFRIYPPTMLARDFGVWVDPMLIAPVLVALGLKLILPQRKLRISGRAIVFLIVTLGLGPGLLVNVVLKDHWGRSRPVDVAQFGGTEHYVRWWDPRGDCPNNCSFVSGDVAGAFWTIAPAALAPPQWRAITYGAALAFGAGMATLRVMAGAHFVSDVIFAGVFTFLIIWAVHGLIYRWPRTRLTDVDVERALERVAMPGYNFITGLFRK